jgi:O-acetyl-ADP-ribose deacetylase (regulator of RNase III)
MAGRLEILQAHIETLAVDAVVNAANRELLPGSGVDGALRRAAGPELTEHTARMAPVQEGEAVITPGFNAPAKHIIHTVAPIWFLAGAEEDKIAALGACYRNALAQAASLGLVSIAFPCIGTGNFGWPRELACAIAIDNVRAALKAAPSLERVIYCCFTSEDAALYRALLAQA